MANKNKGKVIQMLSPENYIRKKARSLPIYECWINADWEDSGMANIVVARRHSNGNITYCMYLVDLLCLGVKDTHYKFNVTETEYRHFLEKFEGRMDVEIAGYTLVHNIILAGVEFSEEYGFKPHKDFTSVTEFMLEEDGEDIDLIEIECGRDGKPMYVQGPFDDAAKANKIMKQLEHSAGAGNFDFMKEVDEDFEDEFEDDEDDEDDEFKDLTLEEKGIELMRNFNRLPKLNDAEHQNFLSLLQSIVNDFVDVSEHNRFYNKLTEELTLIKIDHEKLPNELLGIDTGNIQVSNEIKQGFLWVVNGTCSLKQAKKHFKLFSKNTGVDAAIDYLDMVISGLDHSRKYESKLKEAALKHPNYALLQLKWTKNRILPAVNMKLLPHYPCKLDNFFQGRDYIHPWEYFCYLDTFIHFVIAENNFAKLDALKTVINEIDLDEKEIEIFIAIINLMQLQIVVNYFSEKKH